MGKCLDGLGNCHLKRFRGLMKSTDPGKNFRRTECLYNTGDLTTVFQNIFWNGRAGLRLEINIQD